MKAVSNVLKKIPVMTVLFLILLPALVLADPGNNYCITPAFITAGIPPNLLLMIDNSSSMYDLSYADDGNVSGGTITRQPYYCYDETYKSNVCSGDSTRTCTADSDCVSGQTCNNLYAGYFATNTYYQYDFTNKYFTVAASFPASTSSSKVITNTLFVDFDTSTTPQVNRFIAKGNYLNWLTASKFDVEKKVLTGGKYVTKVCSGDPANRACTTASDCASGQTCGAVTSFIQPESRGCVGQSFIKEPLTSDFVNFTSSQTDPNTSLGLTFAVKGPSDSVNPSAPSRGGQTYLEIYSGNYNQQACQNAVDLYLASSTTSQPVVSDAIAKCINYSSAASNYCQGNSAMTCSTDANCVVVTSGTQGRCRNKTTLGCYYDTDCYSGAAYKGPCDGASPGTPTNYGPCVIPSQSLVVKTKVAYSEVIQSCWSYIRNGTMSTGDFNRLTTGGKCNDVYNAGLCSNDPTKGCAATSDCGTGTCVKGPGVCLNDNNKVCATDANCAAGTCTKGPNSILPGSPAEICGSSYLGSYYTGSSPTWTNSWSTDDTGMTNTVTNFCQAKQPTVIDPTDSAATSTNYESFPSMLGGIALEGQLGRKVGRLAVKINTSTPPTGLIQEFGNRLRVGVMSFNQFGSPTEAGHCANNTAISCTTDKDCGAGGTCFGPPRVCSNDHSRLCIYDADCGAGNTCLSATSSASYNLDGGKILYDIGTGHCATMTASACKTDADCTSPQTCLSGYCGTRTSTVCYNNLLCTSPQVCQIDGAGDHTASGALVNAIDGIKANAWTPFAEAFYNVIGYFAQKLDAGGNNLDFYSRDTVKLNTGDFNPDRNPSQYRCQQNFVLLISDGSSTADSNSTVNSLANRYSSDAGITSSTCPTYAGSTNLPIMAWLAKNRDIARFSTSTASTVAPVNPRDSVGTYVVFNGSSNNQAGECNSLTLLTDTADKGGTTIKQANKPGALSKELRSVFEELAARVASGTAASILSNSEGSGANILQAVFYPKKIFENQTYANWVGEMQNLWYYVDPQINNSTIREDSDFASTSPDHVLNLVSDYVTQFFFDTSTNQTNVKLLKDTNGDGVGDATPSHESRFITDNPAVVSSDSVKSIWRAGKLLWARDLTTSPRTIKTTTDGASLINFSTANAPTLESYLQAAPSASHTEATNIINYVNGIDYPRAGLEATDPTYRPRTVDIKDPDSGATSTSVWKLGDIITSTPRIQSTVRLNTYNLPAPGGYNDASYASFINSKDYQKRGMVYVGANDGMLHAFKLGKLDVTASGFKKAKLTGTDLGKEEWAFIPKNVLPYLKYTTDTNYAHLYFIDGSTTIVDASIGVINGCTQATYDTCVKQSSVVDSDSANNLDATKNTWRTVLIGGMGLGGASRNINDATCDEGGSGACVKTPVDGVGYSSYFALDITNQTFDPTTGALAGPPTLMWEFNNPALGYATTGPAIVRVGDPAKNGKWFAVFGSGPTGPIDTDAHQFKGTSNQNLKFFVVDLNATPPFSLGTNYWVIDTGIHNAFAGSMIGAAIDADRSNLSSGRNYKDDALYVGYVKANSDPLTSSTTWTKGGVLRLVTKEDPNPANWVPSTVIDDIGPVTTQIARLQDTKNKNLWLYFGTGRYYYRIATTLDDFSGGRALYGIKEPCYNTSASPGNVLDWTCTDPRNETLARQTDTINTVDKGWYVELDGPATGFGAERVVTDTVALTNSAVFFTSFKPTTDPCGFGGNSYLWGVKYDTGGQASCAALIGKALIQLSTGEFKEVDLSSVFGCPPPPSGPVPPPGPTPPPTPPPPPPEKLGRRMATPMTGKPPADAPPLISKSGNKPVKKILHIQER